MELPSIERAGDTWSLAWTEHDVAYGFERLREFNGKLNALVTVESTRPDLNGRVLGPVWVDLRDAYSQRKLADTLKSRVNHSPWMDLTINSCAIVAKQYGAASPTVKLNQVKDIGPVEYLVPGLVPMGETTFLYGDSESAKSLLALRIAMSVASGMPLPWGTTPTRKLNVLILDWETNERTVAMRLQRLCAGTENCDVVPEILYRGTMRDRRDAAPLRPLTEEVANIREQIYRDDIGLVLLDSIGYAVDGKLSDDEVARQGAKDLRMLAPTTRLVVAHISKADADKSAGRVDPFGSAFWRASMRSGFEVRRSQEDSSKNQIAVGLWQWKSNDGDHVRPFGLRVLFDDYADGPIQIQPLSVHDVPDLAVRTTLSSRLRVLLRKGANDIETLADEINAAYDTENPVSATTIKNSLSRMPDVIRVVTDQNGTGKFGLSS